METNTTSVELSLPTDEEYIIQIKPFGEGGEGSSSRQITIPRIAGQLHASQHHKGAVWPGGAGITVVYVQVLST